jgi:hypothetical protein
VTTRGGHVDLLLHASISALSTRNRSAHSRARTRGAEPIFRALFIGASPKRARPAEKVE